MTNPNDPAFDKTQREFDNSSYSARVITRQWNDGLTKREWYAGLAMQAILSGHLSLKLGDVSNENNKPSKEIMAIASLQFADALIAELNKNG